MYSGKDKYRFSKFVNLHLARAYEVMSAKEYHELTGEGQSVDGDTKLLTWRKPDWNDEELGPDRKKAILLKMV